MKGTRRIESNELSCPPPSTFAFVVLSAADFPCGRSFVPRCSIHCFQAGQLPRLVFEQARSRPNCCSLIPSTAVLWHGHGALWLRPIAGSHPPVPRLYLLPSPPR